MKLPGRGLSLKALKALQTQPTERPEFLAFPKDFLWGASTSAYQVEGGIHNDWTAMGLDAGQAADHYQRYAEDFDHAKTMGHNAHRFSLEWSRFEPRRGEWNSEATAHYRRVLMSLKARGIQPFVALWHFTQPQWFAARGGWREEANIEDWLNFVGRVVTELGDLAEFWVTQNEPLVYAFQAYDDGRWPPFQHSRHLALKVARNLLLAHARAYHLIKSIQPQAQVGLVKNMTVMDPQYLWHPLSQMITHIQNNLFNTAIWQALVSGRLDIRLPGMQPVTIAPMRELKGALDFMGINYYTRYLVSPGGGLVTRAGTPQSDLGWELYSEGLTRVLNQAAPYARELGVPIYVTENGLADSQDRFRGAYLVQHLLKLWEAVQAGLPIKGYFHWSLMDNYEWADGYGYHFGLLDAERHWRDSARLYQAIIQGNGFPADWAGAHRYSFSNELHE